MEEKSSKSAGQTASAGKGCSVDWSWLAGRKIVRAENDLQNMVFEFEDGQTFTVQALMYKGEAFLGFKPYKDPKAS
ncbi:MAG TPA: hypothetical protein VH186_35410 [Chloroflexia bacterium]|nr:hypothetical protein [Chloroflexia bacterium]